MIDRQFAFRDRCVEKALVKPEPGNENQRSMSETFPSGPWVGFYTYSGHSKKYMMDLVLEFKRGKMTGDGADGIGLFVISGHYSVSSGECSWAKQYVGRHAVDYKGYREGKGIWGNWVVSSAKGGFHIWPLSESSPQNLAQENEAIEQQKLAPR